MLIVNSNVAKILNAAKNMHFGDNRNSAASENCLNIDRNELTIFQKDARTFTEHGEVVENGKSSCCEIRFR